MPLSEADLDDAVVLRVSCAGEGRELRPVFERYGVALLGWGDTGDWSKDADRDHFTTGGRRALGAFAAARINDVIVMNQGASIRAVGIVAVDYRWHAEFSNIQGWDMQHCLRVRWVPTPILDASPPPNIRGRPNTCSRLGGGNQEAAEWARERVKEAIRGGLLSRALPKLPPTPSPLPDSQVPGCFAEIVDRARTLNDAVRKDRVWADVPSEHETVALLVVPLLLAAGWQPVQLALEWRHIDVAVFRSAIRDPQDCGLVVEAKKFNRGLAGARPQAFSYAARHGLDDVPICTTDGCDWELYKNRFDDEPLRAYLPKLDQSAEKFFARFARLCTPTGHWPLD